MLKTTARWLHRFGLELRQLSASYDYASAVRFEPGYPFPDSAERATTQVLDPEPSGAHVAAYATSRVLATERLAVELGLLFGVLATVTGAIWARFMWGAYWNWDPRQTSIVIALLFYAAYLALRAAVEDEPTRRRLAAAYAVLGLAVAPFLFFVLPRLTFSLHPDTVVNTRTGRKVKIGRLVRIHADQMEGIDRAPAGPDQSVEVENAHQVVRSAVFQEHWAPPLDIV